MSIQDCRTTISLPPGDVIKTILYGSLEETEFKAVIIYSVEQKNEKFNSAELLFIHWKLMGP